MAHWQSVCWNVHNNSFQSCDFIQSYQIKGFNSWCGSWRHWRQMSSYHRDSFGKSVSSQYELLRLNPLLSLIFSHCPLCLISISKRMSHFGKIKMSRVTSGNQSLRSYKSWKPSRCDTIGAKAKASDTNLEGWRQRSLAAELRAMALESKDWSSSWFTQREVSTVTFDTSFWACKVPQML